MFRVAADEEPAQASSSVRKLDTAIRKGQPATLPPTSARSTRQDENDDDLERPRRKRGERSKSNTLAWIMAGTGGGLFLLLIVLGVLIGVGNSSSPTGMPNARESRAKNSFPTDAAASARGVNAAAVPAIESTKSPEASAPVNGANRSDSPGSLAPNVARQQPANLSAPSPPAGWREYRPGDFSFGIWVPVRWFAQGVRSHDLGARGGPIQVRASSAVLPVVYPVRPPRSV